MDFEDFEVTKKVDLVLNTAGDGLWSDAQKAVKVTGMEVNWTVWDDEDRIWGELRVFFDVDTWDTSEDGLIYTDEQFQVELLEALDAMGLAGHITYSEQGMQGANFVSFDVDQAFIESFQK